MSLENLDILELNKKYDSLSKEERKKYCCLFIHVSRHLETNIEEAESDPNYRNRHKSLQHDAAARREILRSKIALSNLKKWSNQFDSEQK